MTFGQSNIFVLKRGLLVIQSPLVRSSTRIHGRRLRTIEAIWRHLGTIHKKVGRCLTEKDLRLSEFAPMASVAKPYVHSAEGAL
jgi:hypothetical protein